MPVTVVHRDLQKCNPCRQLSWRWDRAFLLLEDDRPFSPDRNDEYTGLAYCYLRELRQCRDEEAREKLYRRYPEVRAARLLDERGDRTTVEIQARLPARRSKRRPPWPAYLSRW